MEERRDRKPDSGRQELKLWITSLLSGYAAEIQAGHEDFGAYYSSWTDFQEAKKLIEKHFPGKSIDDFLPAAHRFVHQHWTTIEALAEALLKFEVLNGRDISWIVRQHTQKATNEVSLESCRR